MGLLRYDRAWEDYLYWQAQDKKLLKRLNAILRDIQRDSRDGLGKPEPLKENMSGWWSRRIDEENRIVDREQGGDIIIASCKGHDK